MIYFREDQEEKRQRPKREVEHDSRFSNPPQIDLLTLIRHAFLEMVPAPFPTTIWDGDPIPESTYDRVNCPAVTLASLKRLSGNIDRHPLNTHMRTSGLKDY